MGYSLRKAGAANYAEAEKFYDEALRIDPKHRGALEYSGELYLMTGNLPMAEQRLATLDKVCFLPCEEYTDLKKAVARYKATGNKYVGRVNRIGGVATRLLRHSANCVPLRRRVRRRGRRRRRPILDRDESSHRRDR